MEEKTSSTEEYKISELYLPGPSDRKKGSKHGGWAEPEKGAEAA